jgi:methylated-DNA-[protein]-cysteine S-methyltransferase
MHHRRFRVRTFDAENMAVTPREAENGRRWRPRRPTFDDHKGIALPENQETKMATTRKGAAREYVCKHVDTPVGRLKMVASRDGLAAILWEHDRPGRVRLDVVAEVPDHPVLLDAERQLADYFAGRRQVFDVKLDFAGTAFQKSVWAALLTIPFGETRSYAEIARQIGIPKAVRAVGAANGRNPISIIAPCHRVVGSNGDLTGFAGGIEVKAHLLGLEGTKTGLFDRAA